MGSMKYIKTKKFSDANLSVKIIFPLDASKITLMNIWVLMMRKKTASFPSRQALTQELLKLYGMNAAIHLSGYGPQVIVDVRFRMVRSDLVDDENYDQRALALMHEILYSPILDEEGLEEAKYVLKNRLLRQYDDPDTFVTQQAMLSIDANHPIRIPLNGKKEEIEAVTLEQVKDLYDTFIQMPKYTTIVGECPKEYLSYFETFETEEMEPVQLKALRSDCDVHKQFQREISQSGIAKIYSTDALIREADFPALMVMNSILGQSPSSLLFTNIREKHSYCYSISSSLFRFDGALMIVTGTQRENIDAVLELIREQLVIIECGTYSNELLNIAKKDLLDGFMAVEDHPVKMMEQAFLDQWLGSEYSLEEKKADIMKVTKGMISDVALRLQPVSEVILEGTLDE